MLMFPTHEVVMMGDRLESILASKRCPQRVSFVRDDNAGIVFSVSGAAHVLALRSVKDEMDLALGTSVNISDELFGVQQITVFKAGKEKTHDWQTIQNLAGMIPYRIIIKNVLSFSMTVWLGSAFAEPFLFPGNYLYFLPRRYCLVGLGLTFNRESAVV